MSDLEDLVGSRARDDNGRFVTVTPTEEPKAETPTPVVDTPEPVATPALVVAPVAAVEPTETDKEKAYKAAMLDERRKFQALQREVQELKQPKKEPVDPWQDLPGALKSQQAELQETLFVERCNLTAEISRQKHTDYDEMQAAFLEAAESDPSLFARLRQERNPAEFAYREGLRSKELKDVGGDFSAYKSKLEKDIETRLEAKFAAKYGVKPAVVPTSLNSDTSPVAATEVYGGPPPLNKILRNARS